MGIAATKDPTDTTGTPASAVEPTTDQATPPPQTPPPETASIVISPVVSLAEQFALEIDNLISQPPLSKQDQQRIRDIFCSIEDFITLFRLQLLINLGGDRYDLEKLIFRDIGDKKMRQEILDHFKSVRPQDGMQLPPMLLSDVDDTILYTFNDKRYQDRLRRNDIYPDALAFIEAATGTLGSLVGRSHYITLLTARPEGLFENGTLDHLAEKGVEHATALTGRLGYLLSSECMKEYKLKNFSHLAELFPHCDFVFVGDNGQGDVLFADQIQIWDNDPHHPLYNRVSFCMIHRVVPHNPDKHKTHVASEELLASRGIYLFDDYQEALSIAAEQDPNWIDQAARLQFQRASQR